MILARIQAGVNILGEGVYAGSVLQSALAIDGVYELVYWARLVMRSSPNGVPVQSLESEAGAGRWRYRP